MMSRREIAAVEPAHDERALRREWRFERIGWAAIALLLAAGIAGAFGDGALASARISSAEGDVEVHYERIMRHGAAGRIELRLAPMAAADSVVLVSLDGEYLDDVTVQQVSPAPLRVRASSGRMEYHLLRLDAGQPMTVVFTVQPGRAGARRAKLGTGQSTLELRQFVLP